jgi:Rrf2 family protein
MLSKKAKYALQACLALAGEKPGTPVLIADLAERDGIPKKFLEVILLDLRNAGILASRKGKGGGYHLAKPAKEVAVGQVIRLIDGPVAPVPCVSKMAYQRCSECKDEAGCGIRMVMKDVRDAIADIYDNTTLADILERQDKARRHPTDPFDWVI